MVLMQSNVFNQLYTQVCRLSHLVQDMSVKEGREVVYQSLISVTVKKNALRVTTRNTVAPVVVWVK